jgi:hypothetical protein
MEAIGKLPGAKRQGVILYRWTGDEAPEIWRGLKKGYDSSFGYETNIQRDVSALVDPNGKMRHEVVITVSQGKDATMSLDPNGFKVDLAWRGITVLQARARRLKSSVTTPALVSKMTLTGPGLEAGQKTVVYVSTEGSGELMVTVTGKSSSGESITRDPVRLELN